MAKQTRENPHLNNKVPTTPVQIELVSEKDVQYPKIPQNKSNET